MLALGVGGDVGPPDAPRRAATTNVGGLVPPTQRLLVQVRVADETPDGGRRTARSAFAMQFRLSRMCNLRVRGATHDAVVDVAVAASRRFRPWIRARRTGEQAPSARRRTAWRAFTIDTGQNRRVALAFVTVTSYVGPWNRLENRRLRTGTASRAVVQIVREVGLEVG